MAHLINSTNIFEILEVLQLLNTFGHTVGHLTDAVLSLNPLRRLLPLCSEFLIVHKSVQFACQLLLGEIVEVHLETKASLLYARGVVKLVAKA